MARAVKGLLVLVVAIVLCATITGVKADTGFKKVQNNISVSEMTNFIETNTEVNTITPTTIPSSGDNMMFGISILVICAVYICGLTVYTKQKVLE